MASRMLWFFCIMMNISSPSAAENHDVESDGSLGAATLSTESQVIAMSPETAREASKPAFENGPAKVILLIGSNFDLEALESVEYHFDRRNIRYEIFHGGERERFFQIFLSGAEIPGYFDERFAVDGLVPLIVVLQQDHALNIYRTD